MKGTAKVCLAIALALASRPAQAQILRGQVQDAITLRGISNAEVILLDTLGARQTSALTDSAGLFRITVKSAGIYRVRIQSLGYQSTEVDSLDIGEAEEVLVNLRLGVDAIPINAIEVRGRSRFFVGRLQEFYERKERMQKLGLGRFMTREEIEMRPGAYATDLLRSFPSITVGGNQSKTVYMRRNGRECQPQIYLDGMLLNRRGASIGSLDDFLTGDDIEGIEVYHGLTQGPGDYHDTSGCGVILVWTRRGVTDGEKFSWRRLIGAGVVGLILFTMFH